MADVYLVLPALEWKEPYLDFYREWIGSGEDIVPWVVEQDPSDFQAMIGWLEDMSNGIGLQEGWVASSTYWLATEDRRIVGAVNIRHALSPWLMERGGHIGYGIRPSARRQGYATKLLALSLGKTRELGIQRVLVCCDENNAASARTILNNGGIEDKSFTEENGNVIRRFWIEG
ncbi:MULTISPECIES: GNAT family N-acetyltransferase [unclassified Paenibacillus]|uniref:GNAT family N-acetyltransferase n=1 Tax=unclassified Paenibacillus TaxID=185978 RepID=UPI00104D3A90|nr:MULTISPECIES: GNAT family N-acetyltransferase [unclassified Paenibacillus]NIK69712.1 putative acetyltransferase [Paenibacillus sp. BK720]TCM95886.1 putative acetyltransferase [Paenibacillus sp. BK033]